jgi:alkyl sulfatase BDS1-like metallo-beta-lactamase superfamily hydrolase
VRAIWEGYAGWFHHRSSTELYPVPYWSVHGDLVELAGGTTAIVERARERLEAGEPVEALHLCEVALAHDAADRGALEASSAAHEALLEHSGDRNFWEVAWLEKELERLRGLLGTG